MATAAQIKALVKSFANGDETAFFATATQIAAAAARKGQVQFAEEMKRLIDLSRERLSMGANIARFRTSTTVQPSGELAGLLSVSHPERRLGDAVFSAEVSDKLQRVLHEQRQRDRLRQHGLSPQRKILLVGPPGTGKTMTAAILAGELEVALCTVQFDALITKYMGETAAKLRLIFDAASRSRCVLFFDEMDALGGDRGARNDVGEIRRVLNSFLQFIEQDESDSLIVGATNHQALLDRALFRRFDVLVEYGLPNAAELETLLKTRLGLLDTSDVDWTAAAKAAKGLSHADVVRACEQATKDALLADQRAPDINSLIRHLDERGARGTPQ